MSASPAATLLGRLSPRASMAAGAVVLIATVVAYVYMSHHGSDTTGLLLLAVPVIGALFQQGGLSVTTTDQTASIVAAVQGLGDHPELRQALAAVVHEVLDSRAAAAALPAPRATSPATTTAGAA